MQLTSCLLSSAAAQTALLEVLRWSNGPLQAELSRCRLASSTAALDAAEPPCAPAMLLVLASALGLLARLLRAAHGAHCALHDATFDFGGRMTCEPGTSPIVYYHDYEDDGSVDHEGTVEPCSYDDCGGGAAPAPDAPRVCFSGVVPADLQTLQQVALAYGAHLRTPSQTEPQAVAPSLLSWPPARSRVEQSCRASSWCASSPPACSSWPTRSSG